MTGSVIDGEDVLQEALVKAIEALPRPGRSTIRMAGCFASRTIPRSIICAPVRGVDRLVGEGDPDMTADPVNRIADREIVGASLRSFMRLPAQQRSSVILMDVLGYSLDEIGSITAMTVPGIKAALHRGRARLRELAATSGETSSPQLGTRERALLAAYVDRFNAHDVDGFRNLLAEDVRLEVVTRFKRQGRADVGTYVTRYEAQDDWRLVPGLVEGRPAALVIDPREASGKPTYFVLLDLGTGAVTAITDFRYARYVMDGAETVVL